ncbi:hypothetical protein BO78DRAFT_438285, partial [Aspergillus sclerotiicarbonarius CBS 121057]
PAALIPHKPNIWTPPPIPPTSDLYHPTDPDNLEMRFEFSLLDHIHISTPLFHVNRESRAVANAWAACAQNNLSVHQIPTNHTQTTPVQNQAMVYARQFNPHTDILYTTPTNILDLIVGPFDRLDQPDLNGKGARLEFELRYLAISEEVIWMDPGVVGEVLDMGVMPEVLFVVLGRQPEWVEGGEGVGVQRWWGVQGEGMGWFGWDGERGVFELRGRKGKGDGNGDGEEGKLYKRLKEVCDGIAKVLTDWRKRRFEVRLVGAVRR